MTDLTPREKLVVAATLREMAVFSQYGTGAQPHALRERAAALEAEAAAVCPKCGVDLIAYGRTICEKCIAEIRSIQPPAESVCECGHKHDDGGCENAHCPCTAYRPKAAETPPQARPQDCPLCGWTPKDGGSVIWCANAKCELSPPCFSRPVWNRIRIAPESPQPEPTPQPAPPYKNTFVEPKPMEDVLKAAMNQKGSGFPPEHSSQFVSAHNESSDAGGWSEEIAEKWRILSSGASAGAFTSVWSRELRAALAELDRQRGELGRLSVSRTADVAQLIHEKNQLRERAEKAEARAAGLASDLDDAAKAIARAQEMAK